jgi:GST-like protein
MFGHYMHLVRFGATGNDYSKSWFLIQAVRASEVIDQRLATVPYLSGAEYSIADIATFPWMRNISSLVGAEAMAKLPNIARWAKAIDERSPVKKALAEVDAVRARTTPFERAETATLDKVFGRGAAA